MYAVERFGEKIHLVPLASGTAVLTPELEIRLTDLHNNGTDLQDLFL